MRYKVSVSSQVLRFVERLPQAPRRSIRSALRGLRDELGDLRALEYPLGGYCRLRVGKFRLIIEYAADRTILVVFAGDRRLVYEAFEAEFVLRLRQTPPK